MILFLPMVNDLCLRNRVKRLVKLFLLSFIHGHLIDLLVYLLKVFSGEKRNSQTLRIKTNLGIITI
jgi:hypothetical protein